MFVILVLVFILVQNISTKKPESTLIKSDQESIMKDFLNLLLIENLSDGIIAATQRDTLQYYYQCLDGQAPMSTPSGYSYTCKNFLTGIRIYGEQEVRTRCSNTPTCTGYDYTAFGYGHLCQQSEYPGASRRQRNYKLCRKLAIPTEAPTTTIATTASPTTTASPLGKAVSLSCAVGNMTAKFDENALPKKILNISIVGCDPSTYVVDKHTVSTDFKDCAKNITQGNDVITQENIVAVVTGTRDPKVIIERVTVYYFKLECKFNRHLNVTLGAAVNVIDRKESFQEAKITNFAASMMAYQTANFAVLAASPLKVTADDPIFMQIVGIHHNQNFKFITEDCFATPSKSPSDSLQYLFFAEKCPLDETFKEYNPNTKNKFSFSINAFTFIQIKKSVYFHCSLLICRINSETEACTQKCKSSNRKRESEAEKGGIENIMVQSGEIEWESKQTLDVQVHDIAERPELDVKVKRLEGEFTDIMDELARF